MQPGRRRGGREWRRDFVQVLKLYFPTSQNREVGHPRNWLTLFPERQESVTVHHIAVHDDAGDAAGVPDIRGRIGVHDENIGAASGGDQAQLVPAELDRVVVGGGGQRLARRKPQPDQQFKLGVQGDSGHGTHRGPRAHHPGPRQPVC